MYIYNTLFSSVTISDSLLDRDRFDIYSSERNKEFINIKKKIPKISAVIRVKNGQEYIESSILSISPLVSEIILVDNLSTDDTKSIVDRLAVELVGVCDIKYFTYSEKLAVAGNGYLRRVESGEGASLASYYNYCFGLATCEYVMKWDAHLLLFPNAIEKIQRTIASGLYDAIKFRGIELYGKVLSREISLYRNDGSIYYCDSEHYEVININRNIRVASIYKPIFLHLKRLSYIKYNNIEGSPIHEKYR